MSNTPQFQYPTGSDKEILIALVQNLAETVSREDHSMDQYLKPEDCHDYERFSKPMSETIKDFRESGNAVTKMALHYSKSAPQIQAQNTGIT